MQCFRCRSTRLWTWPSAWDSVRIESKKTPNNKMKTGRGERTYSATSIAVNQHVFCAVVTYLPRGIPHDACIKTSGPQPTAGGHWRRSFWQQQLGDAQQRKRSPDNEPRGKSDSSVDPIEVLRYLPRRLLRDKPKTRRKRFPRRRHFPRRRFPRAWMKRPS